MIYFPCVTDTNYLLIFLFLLTCLGRKLSAYTLKNSTGSCGWLPVTSWNAVVDM